MKVKIKKLNPNAVIPKYSKPGDAGMDFVATEILIDEAHQNVVYKTGIALEIPEGYVGLLFPRSSIYKTVLSLTNSVGVIDSGYRGEIMFRFHDEFNSEGDIHTRFTKWPKEYYKVGDRVGQIIIVPYPQIEFEETDELETSQRGDGGFGSTGN